MSYICIISKINHYPKRIMTKTIALAICVSVSSCLFSCAKGGDEAGLKPRLVVLTDIGPADVEPDDNESAVRLLAYADRFEIEAICTTVGWNCDPYPVEWAEYLNRVIDAYQSDVPNLMKRSGQTEFLGIDDENGSQRIGYWPSADYLRGRALMGSTKAGIGVIGEGNDSPGSDMLIRLADEDDPRPIYVTAWGSGNTLAQAIWRVKQTRSPEEVKRFVRKFRLYTITDQDMKYAMRMQRDYSSHQWLRTEFPDDLLLVWDESAWLNQNALGKQNWEKYAELIQKKGALGKVYPDFLWGVEGDTPSFLNCMPNGLNDPDDPTQVGWGGYHVFAVSPDGHSMAWTNWHEPVKSISDSYEKRFYDDEFNDFAARMQWAEEGKGNLNPELKVVAKKVDGGRMRLDASGSYDPDGDALSFLWWTQGASGMEVLGNELVLVMDADKMPESIVCEVHDDGPFRLVAYKRIAPRSADCDGVLD